MPLFERNDMVVTIAAGEPPLKVIGYNAVGRVLTGRFEGDQWVRQDYAEDELVLEDDWLGAGAGKTKDSDETYEERLAKADAAAKAKAAARLDYGSHGVSHEAAKGVPPVESAYAEERSKAISANVKVKETDPDKGADIPTSQRGPEKTAEEAEAERKAADELKARKAVEEREKAEGHSEGFPVPAKGKLEGDELVEDEPDDEDEVERDWTQPKKPAASKKADKPEAKSDKAGKSGKRSW